MSKTCPCRYALWWSLIRGCEKVERIALERRSDVKEALLDWFGVGIKAQEISAFVKRMDLLAQRVGLYTLMTISQSLPGCQAKTQALKIER